MSLRDLSKLIPRHIESTISSSSNNLIRLPTPNFTFEELLNPENPLSPLVKLKELEASIQKQSSMMALEAELKLFANIYRQTIRNAIDPIIHHLEKASSERILKNAKRRSFNCFQISKASIENLLLRKKSHC